MISMAEGRHVLLKIVHSLSTFVANGDKENKTRVSTKHQ